MKPITKKIWISLISAFVFGASAVSGLAAYFNFQVGFIPGFLGNELALKVFLLLAGLLLLYDSFNLRTAEGHIKITSILTGFLLAFLGAFPLMNQVRMLDFLPFVIELSLNPAVLAGLLLFYSLYLVWDVYLFLNPK